MHVIDNQSLLYRIFAHIYWCMVLIVSELHLGSWSSSMAEKEKKWFSPVPFKCFLNTKIFLWNYTSYIGRPVPTKLNSGLLRSSIPQESICTLTVIRTRQLPLSQLLNLPTWHVTGFGSSLHFDSTLTISSKINYFVLLDVPQRRKCTILHYYQISILPHSFTIVWIWWIKLNWHCSFKNSHSTLKY